MLSKEFKKQIVDTLNDYESSEIFDNLMYVTNLLKVIATIVKD